MTAELTLSWAAGLIDGEGFIGVYKHRRISPPYPAYEGEVSLAMTHEPTIRHFYTIFKLGSIYIVQGLGNRKPVYKLTIRGTNHVKSILRQILPFLVTKKEQARLVLEFVDRREKPNRYRPLTANGLAEREFFHKLLQAMNLRGISNS